MEYHPIPESGDSGEIPALRPSQYGTQDDASPPARYDANLRLIRRRLADEQRTAVRPRRWWKYKF